MQDILLLYAEERFEEHRADARPVLSARAVPQEPVALHRKAEKAAQTLLRLLVEDDAAVGVDHIVIRRAELLLDAAALRLDEETGGALCRDTARGRAEKRQRDIFGAFEKGVGMFAALGIGAQVDDGADAEPFERRLRALGEAGEPAAPEELARFDGAAALRGMPPRSRVLLSFLSFSLWIFIRPILYAKGLCLSSMQLPPPEKTEKQAAETACFDR